MNTNKDILLKIVRNHTNDTGNLIAFDHEKDFQKLIKRSFVVNCSEATIRGRHAHKKLNQFLICIRGICKVICEDGISREEITLDKPNQILKIPSQIWSEQHYIVKDTSLLVMCDQVFIEEDYIRDYNKFIEYRNNS